MQKRNNSITELKSLIAKSEVIANKQRCLPGSFSETLVRMMEDKDITRSKLGALSALSEISISRMRSGDEYNPSKQMVIAACVGLSLSPAEAISLFEKSGNRLKLTNAQDVAYQQILCSCREYSVTEINEALYEQGFELLGSKK